MSAVEVILTVLTVLLWIVVGIAGIVLFALCTPIRVSGAVYGLNVNETTGADFDETHWHFRVVWLLGLVSVIGAKAVGETSAMRLRLVGIPIKLDGSGRERKSWRANKRKSESKQKGQGAAARQRNAKGKRSSNMSWADARGLLPEIRWLIAKLWRLPRIEAQGDIVYGFDDPALTGWCEALRAIRPLPRQLRLTPDFTEARLEGWMQLRMAIYPVQVVVVVVRALFRRGVRRIWWSRVKRRISIS